jgi:hypothetical protein
VLSFRGVEAGDCGEPSAEEHNNVSGWVSLSDFGLANDLETPAEPGVTLEFKIVGAGESDIVFDDDIDALPGAGNRLNNDATLPYDVLFVDGAATGTLDSQTSVGSAPATPGVRVR